MSDRSRAALLGFMDYLANKGLMNRATASARKAAVNRVLSILDDGEAADVSKLDIDKVMTRFHHLEGKNYTPASLNVYKSRLKSAIEDFLQYQKDPLNFKPSIQSGSPRTERPKLAGTPSGTTRTETQPKAMAEPPPAAVNIIPIPIRPDLTIKIQGLPFDLTQAEALKIANVIKAMANSE